MTIEDLLEYINDGIIDGVLLPTSKINIRIGYTDDDYECNTLLNDYKELTLVHDNEQ